MLNWSPSHLSLLFSAAALLCLTANVRALEPRTWISLDGRTIDAELIKTEGEIVELKDKEGRTLKVPKLSLSFGDLDYIAEFAPDEKKNGLAPKATGKLKVPNPAKEMKFSPKALKKDAGEIKIGEMAYRVCESPHFKVLYSKGIDPMDTAELAERLWHDTAFFHASFAAKFKNRRMAIILADAEKDFPAVGDWWSEQLKAIGRADDAREIADSWPQSGASGINLPASMAADNGLLESVTVLRMAGRKAAPTKEGRSPGDDGKGVWGSFRTHVLSGDLIGMQAGGLSGFAKDGTFAIFTGHSYFKEIDLTGESKTGIFQKDTGKQLSTSGGYDTGRNWAAELKRRIRKGDVKGNLTALWGGSINDAKPDDLAMAYSFSRFLQSTPERHTAYGRLMQKISVSHQVPDIDSVAKIYGLDDAAALEKEWLAFVDSGDFR